MSEARINDVTEFVLDGTHGSPVRTAGGVPVLSAQNVKGGKLDFQTDRHTSTAEYEDFRRRLPLAVGDVLLTIVGTIGRAAVVEETRPLVFQRSVAVIRPTRDALLPRFLYQVSQSREFQTPLSRSSNQSSQAGVYLGKLKEVRIPLPPLPEQRRIAEVLDRAEALRANRRAALAQLDTLIQSIFLDMFGEPATNPKGWPHMPFADLGENQDSQRVPVKSSNRERRRGQYPYYGASGIIDWVDDFIYDGERLLIGEDGANLVARATPVAYIARGQFWVTNHAHVIADNGRADLRFLEVFIEQLDLKPFISGTAQPKLNRSNLDRIAVPCPPIELQREFARRVKAVEVLKREHCMSRSELDALFTSLQHRAFRGEL